MCDPEMSDLQNIEEKPLDSTEVDHWLENSTERKTDQLQHIRQLYQETAKVL